MQRSQSVVRSAMPNAIALPDHSGQLKFSKMRISMQQELVLVKVLAKFKVKQRFFCIGMDPL